MMTPRISFATKGALQHVSIPHNNMLAYDHGRTWWGHASPVGRAGSVHLPPRRGFTAQKAAANSSSSDEHASVYAPASTAEWTNIMQQQLPPGHSLQPLLQPLLQPSSPGNHVMPGDEVAPIAAASTSLTVGMGTQAVQTAVEPTDPAEPKAGSSSAIIDVAAKEMQDPSKQVPAASAARMLGSHWVKQVAVISFAAMLCYLDRTNISTAIVPMAEQFGWDKQFCGAVLSAFFAGYGATQVYGGVLSDKYGGSAVLALGLGVWSLATALTPMAAAAGTMPLLAARCVLGMAQGVAFPAMHALLAKHVPSKVRSGAIGIIMACAHIGTATGFGASPAIINSMGWQWTYYLFGGAALLWLPLWIHVAREAAKQVAKAAAAATTAAASTAAAAAARAARTVPAAGMAAVPAGVGATAVLCSGTVQEGITTARQAAREAEVVESSRSGHPLLDAIEQQHLQQQQQRQAVPAAPATAAGADSISNGAGQKQKPNVGFWPLMRRKEVWAIAVAQYAAGWGFYGLLAWLPQFLIESCGLQLSQLGGFTLAPYLMQAAVGAGAGIMADNLIVQRNWGVKDVRILMQVAGMLGPAACLFAAASPIGAASPYVATGLITAGMGMSALTCSGVSANHLDIAPRHAGVVFGVGNTAGTLAGLVAVPGLGYVLQHTGNWSLAFGLAAAHNVVGAALWAKWVGDKPLPEDGAEAAPAQQLQLPASELVAVHAAGGELKLKAA